MNPLTLSETTCRFGAEVLIKGSPVQLSTARFLLLNFQNRKGAYNFITYVQVICGIRFT